MIPDQGTIDTAAGRYVRQPLGVKPRYIWIEQRCDDLRRAIREYANQPTVSARDARCIADWAAELADLSTGKA